MPNAPKAVAQEENRKKEAAAVVREKIAANKARRTERDAAVKGISAPQNATPTAAPTAESAAQGSQDAAHALAVDFTTDLEAQPAAALKAEASDDR